MDKNIHERDSRLCNTFFLFIFRYLGFSLSRHPGHWWTALWAACGLGIVLVAVFVLRFIEDEIL